MNIISSRIHGVIDYVVGLLLIAAPWVLGFADDGPATYIPVALGAGTILYSLLTRYEFSIAKLIPFKAHLAMDAIAGLFLAASPGLFGFSDRVYLPHLIVGIMELAVVAMTSRHLSESVHDGQRHGNALPH